MIFWRIDVAYLLSNHFEQWLQHLSRYWNVFWFWFKEFYYFLKKFFYLIFVLFIFLLTRLLRVYIIRRRRVDHLLRLRRVHDAFHRQRCSRSFDCAIANVYSFRYFVSLTTFLIIFIHLIEINFVKRKRQSINQIKFRNSILNIAINEEFSTLYQKFQHQSILLIEKLSCFWKYRIIYQIRLLINRWYIETSSNLKSFCIINEFNFCVEI